jgi:hypothetical protein
MGWVLKCLATSLALWLAGCSDATLTQKVKDLELENAELKKKLEEKLQPAPASDNRLSMEEALQYLEGKPLPLPDNVDGGGKAGKKLLIQRRGVRQLAWESSDSSSLDGYKERTHHYALLYDAEDSRYFAKVLITVRQIGEERVCIGVQVMDVRKVEKTTDPNPK